MAKEFFDQPLIESPITPDDADQIGLGQPGVSGGKNITWAYLKALIQGVVNWITFTPQVTAPTHTEGLIYYDDNSKVLRAFNDISDVALDIGEELWGRVENDNAFVLPNGKVGYVKGSLNSNLTCGLADASEIDSSSRTLGLFTNDIAIGAIGYITRYGLVRDVDTSAWAMGDILYLDAHNPGELTNVKPTSPHYPVRIGVVFFAHATSGAIGVDTLSFNGSDTSVSSDGFMDGIVIKTPSIDITVSGGIIYADVINAEEPTHNLPFLIGGVRYTLDTTTNTGSGGAARIAIPPGLSDTEKQSSILYIRLNAGVPELATTTGAISEPYANLANFTAYNDVRTAADGHIFKYRRSNNAATSEAEGISGSFGLMTVAVNAIRFKLGSNWLSGQDATPTVNNTTIKVVLSTGLGAQLHVSSTPLFDGNNYLIYNTIANAITYASSTNLTDIVTDAAGNSLLSNNTFYTIRLFYQLNSQGIGNHVIATRPLGSYTTAAEALSDPLSYTVGVADHDIEEVIYPLYDIVIGRTGAGGTVITLVNSELIDLRTRLAGQGGTGGGAGDAEQKILIPATQPAIVLGTPNLLTLNMLIKRQAMFEPRLSVGTLTINIDFDFIIDNDANALRMNAVLSLTGTRIIGFESDVLCSESSSIGSWNSSTQELTLTAGTNDIIELKFTRYSTGSNWLLKVEEVAV